MLESLEEVKSNTKMGYTKMGWTTKMTKKITILHSIIFRPLSPWKINKFFGMRIFFSVKQFDYF